MLTTKEASERLGISVRRVNALIASKDLVAEKFGNIWMIDEQSIAARSSAVKLKGRPRMGEKDPNRISRYILMNKNHAICEFWYHTHNQTVGELTPLDDVAFAPPGACKSSGKPTALRLGGWIRDRYIPSLRPNLSRALQELGYANQAELLFNNYGLNLSDHYWFKPVDTELDWHDLNYFENDYQDALGRSLNDEQILLNEVNAASPSSGTPGLLPKWWEKRNGQSYLIKAGSYLDREPYNEMLASQLYKAILQEDDYVPYWIEIKQGRAFSVCPDIVTEKTELISMRDIMACYQNSPSAGYAEYVESCRAFGITDVEQKLAKMIVCDFLTANPDRHDQNLGVIRDVESLEFTGVAPIFDNGRTFYFDARTTADLSNGLFYYISHPFTEYPLVQLALVQDFDWYDPTQLGDFEATITDTLSKNEQIPAEMIEATGAQFKLRLDRLNEYASQFRPLTFSVKWSK